MIREDPQLQQRVLKSYEMMLDFFGMKLKCKETGQIERAHNWDERYQNLETSSHNYLRITRMLKSLRELGFEQYMNPLVLHFLHEITANNRFQGVTHSLMDYWAATLCNSDREQVIKLAKEKGIQTKSARKPVPTTKPLIRNSKYATVHISSTHTLFKDHYYLHLSNTPQRKGISNQLLQQDLLLLR